MVLSEFSWHANVAQLFRALPCQGRGRELESLHSHHNKFAYRPLGRFLYVTDLVAKKENAPAGTHFCF